MVKDQEIKEVVEPLLNPEEYFIVGIQNNQDNIKVIVDGYKGINLDKCSEITREIRNVLGERVDDCNIEVTSPGLTQPFHVKQQYVKNIGNKIDILLHTGEKIRGKLLEVHDDGILIEEKKRIKTEKKKKKTMREEKTIKFDDIDRKSVV
mgnify:CR=1 FL=1